MEPNLIVNDHLDPQAVNSFRACELLDYIARNSKTVSRASLCAVL
jgi:hypothetical protein